MLAGDVLAAKIVAELDHSVQCKNYLKSIKDYVEANIVINANYVGIMNVYPFGPDPLNGPVLLKLNITPTMTQGLQVIAFLKSLKEANPNSFIEAIFSELVMDMIIGQAPYIMSSKAIYQVKSLTSADLNSLKDSKSYVDNWKIISSKVVDSFLTLKETTPLSTVTPSGSGLTTIVSVL